MTCTCQNETCPEVAAAINITNNTYSGLSPALATPSTGTVVLTMPDAGTYHVKAWLVDDVTNYRTTTPSANFADSPPDNVWDVMTDVDGTYTFTVTKTSASSYKLICSVGGIIVISNAFTSL